MLRTVSHEGKKVKTWQFLKMLDKDYHLIQQIHSWVYAQEQLKEKLHTKWIQMFITVLSVVTKSGNNPSVHHHKWTNKMWYNRTMENYSTIKWSTGTSWMDSENIRLSKKMAGTKDHTFYSFIYIKYPK